MKRRLVVLAGVLSLGVLVCAGLGAGPAMAQKVKSDYDKREDFSKFKKYAWGPNYLLTHKRADDQARINTALVNSINQQLQKKGFVLDDKAPDFLVHFDAGAIMQDDVAAQSDILYPGGVNWASDNLGGTTMDVWVSNLAKLRITISDAGTKKPVWRAMASQKVTNLNMNMDEVLKKVDEATDKALKDFPPKK